MSEDRYRACDALERGWFQLPDGSLHGPIGCNGCPVVAQSPDRVGGTVLPKCDCGNCRSWRTQWAALARRERPTECKADVIVIGTAPGEEEVRRGEPLAGPAGRQLNAALSWGGLSAVRLCKMNVCNCRTLKKGVTKLVNRDPQGWEIQECLNRVVWPWLAGYKGTVLVLGAVAYKALTDEAYGSFSTARGHRIRIRFPPTAVLMTV